MTLLKNISPNKLPLTQGGHLNPDAQIDTTVGAYERQWINSGLMQNLSNPVDKPATASSSGGGSGSADGRGVYTAQDDGLMAATYDPLLATGFSTHPDTLFLQRVVVDKPGTLTYLHMIVHTAAATLSYAEGVVYNGLTEKKKATGNASTAVSGTGHRTCTLRSSFEQGETLDVESGDVLYIGLNVDAVTRPALRNIQAATADAINGLKNRSRIGAKSNPAPAQMPSGTPSQVVYWMGLSA